MRVSVVSDRPQSLGHSAKAAALQLYVTHAAVAGQVFDPAGFAPVQLTGSDATLPSLPSIQSTVRVSVVSAAPQWTGQSSNSVASHLSGIQAPVAAQVLVPVGATSVQLESSDAATESLPMHTTLRVFVVSGTPQLVGHAGKRPASQLYVTHAAVAGQWLCTAGLAAVQLATSEVTLPSSPLQSTVRVFVVADRPHVAGQLGKSDASQLYSVQAAVAGHRLCVTGLAAVQLATSEATLPSSPLHSTVRVFVVADRPHVAGQPGKSGASQPDVMQAALAAHVLVVSGLGPVQLSEDAVLPSLPMQSTCRVSVASGSPQSL